MTLYFFYGKECPHCQSMEPLVENLEDEGFEVEWLETWHDEENAEKKEELDDGKCGGVPFFYNTESDQWICGETSFMELEKWAEGEKIS
ncbi:MAG: hypothetical protein SVV03_00835 [Candidatus Nanohaloarchaea archaeon]|nr:hypothetical protein [Candidatus Nanohaloarchaea archaeon]